jgi:dephospho-CoA kinase
MAIHVFGLSGGIGCGKSTVAAQWIARGLPVIDADQLAREVVAPGSGGLAEIVSAFGDSVLSADGSLDRKGLAARVFDDDEARGQLNAITHPRIHMLTGQRIAALDASGEPLVCYDAALLVESGAIEMMRPAVIVAVPRELQIERTMARDECTRAEVEARIDAQMPIDEKIRAADFLIDNSGSVEDVKRLANDVLREICIADDLDPSRYGL